MKKIFTSTLISLFVIFLNAQSYNINSSTVTLDCATGGTLYDSGGPTANYGQNVQEVMTICTNGDPLGIEVINTAFGSVGDYLCIYDGTSPTAPLLDCFTSSNLPTQGATIRSTINNASGCLTFQFVSDATTTGGNFELELECLPACKSIEAVIANTIPSVVPNDTIYINNCFDEAVSFFGSANYDPNTSGYTQSDATSNFYWDFGDGTLDTTQNPTHIFPPGKIFSVNLVVEDAAGCFSRNEIDIRVRQSPDKELFFRPDPIVMCLGDTLEVTSYLERLVIGDSAFLDTITGQSAASVVDTVFLPDDSNGNSGDGITTPVIYPLDIYGYIPGTTLTNPLDVENICIDMEHSFVGDIDIRLVCPNGQFVDLIDFSPPLTPGNNLGIPGTAVVPGTPFTYCWSPTSTAGSIDVGEPSLNNDPITAGTYEAVGNWSDLIGCPFNGEWSIQVFDDYGGDDGWTFGASISLNPQYLLDPDTFLIYYLNPLWDANSKIISPLNDTTIQFYASDTLTERLFFTVQNNLQCDYTDSIDIEIDYFKVEATPADTSICNNDTIQLNASIVGSISTNCELAANPCGTTTAVTVAPQTINSIEGPYDNFWEDSRIQLLYTAAELNALGFNSGNISSLAFNVVTKGSSLPFSNFTIKMQCTNLTALTNSFVSTGFSTVFGPANYTTTTGWNTHNFTNPYSWDGISNLLVEVCFDNNDWSGEDVVQASTTTFNSVAKAETDGSSGCTLSSERILTTRPNIRFNYCGSQGGFVWTPNTTISDPNIEDPIVWPTNSTQYIVSSTSSYNCTYSDTVSINIGGDFSREISNDTTICLGESVQLGVTGGAQTFAWTPNDGSINDTTLAFPTFTPDTTTTYTVALDSTNTCTAYESVTIEVAEFRVDSTKIINEICFEEENGSIEIFSTNSAAVTNYSIDGGVTFVTTNSFSNLAPGVYDIIVQGAANCDTAYQVEVFGNPELLIDSIVAVNPSCGNTSDGSITIYAQGGAGTLNYSIDNGVTFQTSNNFSGLIGGTYFIVVQDSLGCSKDSTYVLTQPDSILIQVIQNDSLNCYNDNDGIIEISASGGVGTLVYSNDNITFNNTSNYTGLSANTYTFYVRDDNMCLDSINVDLEQPDSLFITNIQVDSTNCFGSDLGSLISFDGQGGSLPYTFAIDGVTFVNTNTFNDLPIGNYQLLITDTNGCLSNQIDTSIAAPLLLEFILDSTLNATCGLANGAIYVNGLGGTSPYTYSILGGTPQNNGNFTNLTSGNYDIVITDLNGCDTIQNIIIDGFPPAEISLVTVDSVSCFGLADGEIEVQADNGTSPFEFSIDNGISYQSNGLFNNLIADTYTIILRDSVGCNDTLTQIVEQPTEIILSAVNDSVSCYGLADGELTLSVSGGNPIYQYSLTNDLDLQNNNVYSNLNADTYNVYVVDAKNCRDSIIVEIEQPDTLIITSTIATDISCFGDANGSIEINVSGGTQAYSYSIDNVNFQNNNIINNLNGGVYNIFVTDANNCIASSIDSVFEPADLALTISNFTNITCNSGNNGSIEVSTNGGVAPYQYSIDGVNFQNNAVFNNLTASNYTITVRDNNYCTKTIAQTLTQPDALAVIIDSTNLQCFGNTDGSITITSITGETAPYSVIFNSGAPQNYTQGMTFNNLSEGTYNITISDANGCPLNGFSQNVTIEVPSLFEIDTIITNDPLCFGGDDGSITITTNSGGVAPYEYYIFDGTDSTSNLSGVFNAVSEGIYAIWVQDQNGCTVQGLDSIIAPDELILNIDSVVNPSCFGYNDGNIQVSAIGGTPYSTGNPYVFLLNDETPDINGLFIELEEDLYTISVSDENECITTLQVQIQDPEPVIAEITPQDTLIEMGDTLNLSVVLTNAVGSDFIYVWSPSEGLSCTDCSNPNVNIYNNEEFSLTFYDENGCFTSTSTYIEVSDTLRYFIPNAFTPDGFDLTNQVFEVYGQDIKFVDMMIFNRWGEKIFETSNALEGWDGTYQNVLQNPGVYTYFIKITFLNDDSVEEKGSVTLIR